MSSTVEIHPFESHLLAGNALGDATTRRVPVYLPPGYESDGRKRFPVLFALAGFTGTGSSFLNHDWYQPNLPAQLDRLIDEGLMPPVIVVMVDGMTWLGGNQYVDSPAVGPWARHVTEELVPWADATYRTVGARANRGVFGKSSGGYGALMMGIEHADTFAGVASHSGDCYFDYCYGPEFPNAADGLRTAGGLGGFLEKLRSRHWPKFPGPLFPALTVTAMSHFYSANPYAPHGIDLPFDESTGERRSAVLERWAQRDPCVIAADHVTDLQSLSLLYFECGTRDQYNLHHGARILSARLEALGVDHVHEEFDDDHRSTSYRYAESLPRLAAALT